MNQLPRANMALNPGQHDADDDRGTGKNRQNEPNGCGGQTRTDAKNWNHKAMRIPGT